jgi:hypothetical protein
MIKIIIIESNRLTFVESETIKLLQQGFVDKGFKIVRRGGKILYRQELIRP